MSGALVKRLHKKLGKKFLYQVSLKEAKLIERAFVEALKEELDVRFRDTIPSDGDPLYRCPLVIPGLGSFKMRTRKGGLQFRVPGQSGFTAPKPPARRLVFTSKWEALP